MAARLRSAITRPISPFSKSVNDIQSFKDKDKDHLIKRLETTHRTLTKLNEENQFYAKQINCLTSQLEVYKSTSNSTDSPLATLRCYQLEETLLFKQSEINRLNEDIERYRLNQLDPVSSEDYWKNRANTYENLYYELEADRAIDKYENTDFLAVMKIQSDSIEELLKTGENTENSAKAQKVRENLELTKALKDSMTREEILKIQRDDLMETLEKASYTENKHFRYPSQGDVELISKMQALEEEVQAYKEQIHLLSSESHKLKSLKSSYTPKKRAEVEAVNELLSTDDLETAADKWKSLGYCQLEGEPLDYSYEYLRNILKHKDSQLTSLDYSRSRDTVAMNNLISQLKEKQNEVDLMKNTISQPTVDIWREGELKALKLKITSLEQELRKKQDKLQETELNINSSNELIESLKDKLNRPTQAESDLRNLVRQKDREINSFITQLENARIECDNYRNKLETLSSIDAALLEKEACVAELEQEIKNLQEYSQSLANKSYSRESIRYSGSYNTSQHQETLTNILKEASSESDEILELKSKNAMLERESKSLENLINSLKSDMSRLQRLFDEERQAHSNTVKLLEAADPKIIEKNTEKYLSTIQNMFNSEIQVLKGKSETLQVELNEKVRDFSRLDEKYRQDVQDLQEQLRKKDENARKINSSIHTDRIRYETLKKETDSQLYTFKSEKDREIELLEISLREKNSEIARKISEAKDREVIIIEKNKDIVKLKDQLMKLRIEYDEHAHLLNNVQDIENKLQHDQQNQKQEITELKLSLESASRLKDSQNNLILEKDQTIQLLSDKLNKLKEDLDKYESQIPTQVTIKTQELEELKLVYEEKLRCVDSQLELSCQRERKLIEDQIETENRLNREIKRNSTQAKKYSEVKYENQLLAEQLKQEKHSMNQEKATFNHDLAIQREQIQYLQGRIKDLQNLEKQLDLISNEHEILKQELSITHKEKEDLRTQFDKKLSSDSELLKLRKESEALRDKLHAFENSIQTLEYDKKNLINSYELAKQDLRDLRAKLDLKDRERPSTPLRDSNNFTDQLQQKDTIITYLTKKLDEMTAERRRAENSIPKTGEHRYDTASKSDSPLRLSELPSSDLQDISHIERYSKLLETIEEIYAKWQKELRLYNLRLDDILTLDKDRRVKEIFDALLSKLKESLIRYQDPSMNRLQQSYHSSDKLLKAIQEGQLQNVEIKQLIIEKIGLEQDLLAKIREKLEDDRVLSKIQSSDSDEIKTWALKRWQNAENEVLLLRQKLSEVSEKQTARTSGFSFDLKSHIERLEERVKQLDETKQQNTELFNREKAQLMTELKQLRKQKEEIQAQHSKMRREFKTKERSWKIALMNLVDQVKLALDSSNLLNPEADPLKLLVSLQSCFDQSTEEKPSKKKYEQDRHIWTSKEQDMTETIDKLLSEKSKLDNRIQSYEATLSELRSLKPQLDESKVKISSLQSEINILNDKIFKLSTYKQPEKPDLDKRIASDLRESYERGKLIGINEGRKLERQDLELESVRVQSLLREYRETRDELSKKNRELTLKLESTNKEDRYFTFAHRENELLNLISQKDKEIYHLQEMMGVTPEPQMSENDIRLELMERRHSAIRDLQEGERKRGVSDPVLRTYIHELDSVLARYEEL